jgi:hypothetical protein
LIAYPGQVLVTDFQEDLQAEATAATTALNSQFKSLTAGLSVAAVMVAAGLLLGMEHPALLCFLPFLVALPAAYSLQVAADCCVLGDYRLRLEQHIGMDSGHDETTPLKGEIGWVRAAAGPRFRVLTAAMATIAVGLAVIAGYHAAQLLVTPWGWVCAVGAAISILWSVGLLGLSGSGLRDACKQTSDDFRGPRNVEDASPESVDAAA